MGSAHERVGEFAGLFAFVNGIDGAGGLAAKWTKRMGARKAVTPDPAVKLGRGTGLLHLLFVLVWIAFIAFVVGF